MSSTRMGVKFAAEIIDTPPLEVTAQEVLFSGADNAPAALRDHFGLDGKGRLTSDETKYIGKRLDSVMPNPEIAKNVYCINDEIWVRTTCPPRSLDALADSLGMEVDQIESVTLPDGEHVDLGARKIPAMVASVWTIDTTDGETVTVDTTGTGRGRTAPGTLLEMAGVEPWRVARVSNTRGKIYTVKIDVSFTPARDSE